MSWKLPTQKDHGANPLVIDPLPATLSSKGTDKGGKSRKEKDVRWVGRKNMGSFVLNWSLPGTRSIARSDGG